MAASDLSTSQDATIANAASLSGAINVSGYRLAAIVMPSGWTAASITFTGSRDGSAFLDVHDSGGAELALTVAASRLVALTAVHAEALRALKLLKVRSGTAAAPVNQLAERTLTLVLVPAV